MNVAQIVDRLQADPHVRRNLTTWRTDPARPPRYAGFPEALNPKLVEALKARGIADLYTHQHDAIEAILAGESVCVVTPTASGKTLCYNLPVLNSLMSNPEGRALYLFPTKALSQDQVTELKTTIDTLDVKIGTYTFDGDTPASARKAVRNSGHIVVTNPDMLHTGILPHHTIWMKLFENLNYVVIDELHHYRGVFGSHLANVVRRLKRICAFYGSDPQFICCSATIHNPKEMAERIVEKPIHLVDNNGAPRGEKHFLFYNPPVVDASLGIRLSSVKEATRLAAQFLSRNIQSIVFARSRLRVEIMTTYLKDAVRKMGKNSDLVPWLPRRLPAQRAARDRKGPAQRRDHGCRQHQRSRAGHRHRLVGRLHHDGLLGQRGEHVAAGRSCGDAARACRWSCWSRQARPLDQFHHPATRSTSSNSRRRARRSIRNNLIIVSSHLKCACFELPFRDGEGFGLDPTSTSENPAIPRRETACCVTCADKWPLERRQVPRGRRQLAHGRAGQRGHTGRVPTMAASIGEVDLFFRTGRSLRERDLPSPERAIHHRTPRSRGPQGLRADRSKLIYYTDAEIKVDLKVLDVFSQRTSWRRGEETTASSAWTWMPTIYKKIKFGTHENVGWGRNPSARKRP